MTVPGQFLMSLDTGGIVTPVAILGVPSPLEKALAWVTHRARHLSFSRA
jgi:hypothetical protein